MAYLPLSTANLPDPVIDPAQGASPEDYFGSVIWAGNGSATKRTDIQFDGVQPDLVWLKNRTLTRDHALHDDVRGLNARIKSNNTETESTTDAPFDTDGFGFDGVGTQLRIATTNSSYNASGSSYVAWGWKASGASGVSNTDGSITSTVSANTTSGFSIVKYSGSNNATESVGHGLNQKPQAILLKKTTTATDWVVYHESVCTDDRHFLYLNTTAALTTGGATRWDISAFDTNTFTVGDDHSVNASGENYIAYCFHSVEGFSKFGSYVGNGSADGTFVYCGFRPAFIMVKRTDSTGSWFIWDTVRETINPLDQNLYANLSNAEASGNELGDALSNGFKIRGTGAQWNASGGTFIYMAFAENPFKYSNAR